MKISKVKIRNFRCFRELDIDVTRTHGLIGENGSGKTSVLEAINFATSSGLPYLDEQDFNNLDIGDLSIEVIFNEPFFNRIPDSYVTQDIPCQSIIMNAHRRERAANGKALSEPFVIEKYTVPIEYDSSHVPVIDTSIANINIPNSITKSLSGWESPRKTSSSLFKFTSSRLTLQNETVNFPDVFYFDRDREEQAKVGYNSLLQRISKDLNWRYRKGWNQTEIEAKWTTFYQEVISTVENPKNLRIIQPIKDRLLEVAGINFSDLELGVLDIEQPFSRSFLSRRVGTNQIDQKRFGSGISILLAYFLLETVSNLTKENIIYLIDEPELHLHPQLQSSLFEEFNKSASQTIYTTQSDCFINVAEWRSISRFKSDFSVFPQSTDLDKILNSKMISDHLDEIKQWHQHQSILFKEDNQIFFARKCLLVEGPAEKYGLPVISEKLKIDIRNVTIISCNGKTKIPYYQLLCNAFRIPFFTLFDLDSKPVDDPENISICDGAISSAIATYSSNFESILGITSDDHKTSEVLNKLDRIEISEISPEIITSLEEISNWMEV